MQQPTLNQRIISPLPIPPPPPKPWESLTSLLFRTAAEIGYPTIRWILSPEVMPGMIDRDQGIDVIRKASAYKFLSDLLDLSEETLYQLTLHRFATQLQGAQLEENRTAEDFHRPLLAHRVVLSHISPPGRSRVCPLCLNEDPSFARLYWNLRSIVACHRHRIFLIDQCPQCSHPIPLMRKSLTHCPKCRHGDYRKAQVTIVEDPFSQVGQTLILDRLGVETANPDDALVAKLSSSPLFGLSPWQYFRLFQAFHLLIAPLFPDASFLRAKGELPCASIAAKRKDMRSFSLKEEAMFIATFHALFADWPEQFFALLQLIAQRRSLRLGQDEIFGSFYSFWLYRELGDPAFEFLREGFAEYLAKHYSWGYINERQRTFQGKHANLLGEKRYLSWNETMDILKVAYSTLDILVKQGTLKVLVHTRGKKREGKVYCFEKTSVEALRRKWDEELSIRTVAQTLGIGKEAVVTLEKAGLLSVTQSVSGSTGSQKNVRRAYTRAGMEQLKARMLAQAVEASAREGNATISLAQAGLTFIPHRSLVTILQQVLSGELIPIDLATDEPLLQRLVLLEKDIARLRKQHIHQQRDNVGVLTLQEVANKLGIGRGLLNYWINHGLLTSGHVKPDTGRSYHGVSQKELDKFRQRYMTTKESASLLGVNQGYLSLLVSRGLLHPVTGGGSQGPARQILFRREEVEGLILPQSIKLQDVAVLFKVGRLEIMHMVMSGQLTACSLDGNTSFVRFLKSDIEAYLRHQIQIYQQAEKQLLSRIENGNNAISLEDAAAMIEVPQETFRKWAYLERLPRRKQMYQHRHKYCVEYRDFLQFVQSLKGETEQRYARVRQYFANQENASITNSGEQ